MRHVLGLSALVFALPASAVTFDWIHVGDPGNAPDTQVMDDGTSGYGSVLYSYNISKYEVTNGQYAEFLNAVADSDPNGLFDAGMALTQFGGITRVGASGSYTYIAKPGFENKPVVYVSFDDAIRFANWLHNGQPTGAQGPGTTETGAYTITSGTVPLRNVGAQFFVTSEDEWYKAAFYDAASDTYFDYPTATNVAIGCVLPAADTGNSANCWPATSPDGALTDVGSYALSPSPYGTFDQAGNVTEWNESEGSNPFRRGLRGGPWILSSDNQASSIRGQGAANEGAEWIGFRVASLVPEPGTGALVLSGLLGLAALRGRRAQPKPEE